ncbi:MAG: IclR family transcriptional regulator [Deltaproteobacteria bacterium]|nr:IclR family transcriptional regulator [Deltaproteobacteria bacterium]
MNDIQDKEKSSMRSLERTLRILDVLGDAGGSINITRLANACGLSRATVLRIMSVLEKYGYVKKCQRQYWLGAAVLPLAHAYMIGDNLLRVTLPVLQELAHVSDETASLFVRQGFKRILVQRVDGLHPLRFILPIGQGLPLPVGSGKVLAAALPDEELARLIAEMGEITLTNGSRLTRESFEADIACIRQRGYSFSNSERIVGIFSIAAPVLDGEGNTIAAVVVSGASERVTPKRIERLSIQVRAAAKAITERRYGGSHNH